MSTCLRCGSCFRDKWVLERHMSKNKPCVKKVLCENNLPTANPSLPTANPSLPTANPSLPTANPSLPTANPSLPTANPSLPTANTPLCVKITPENKCQFCLNVYARKYNLKIHQQICKYRDDPVRLLEIEKGINFDSFSKTECRFCNHNFFNVSNLHRHLKVCEDRERYHQQLKETVQNNGTLVNVNGNNVNGTMNNVTGTLNNGTINNNNNHGTINNITINNFGEESLKHIQIEKTIDLLRKIRSEYDTDDVYLSAGELIVSFDNYIREIPENRNLEIPDSKCIYANVKTPSGWEMIPVENVLNKGFKKSAGLLYESKETIDETNKRVFESKTNNSIFTEIKQFAQKGFKHSKYGDSKSRQVKTSYKVSKLKKKVKEPIDF
jgi:hypothetical protein